MTYPPEAGTDQPETTSGLARVLPLVVAGLGVVIALLGFTPQYTQQLTSSAVTGGSGGEEVSASFYSVNGSPVALALLLAAGLLAVATLLPRSRTSAAVPAALAVAGFSVLLFQALGKGSTGSSSVQLSVGWGTWVVLVLALLLAAAAVFLLLLEAGIVTPPAPKPAGQGQSGSQGFSQAGSQGFGQPGSQGFGQPGSQGFGQAGPQGYGPGAQGYGPPPQGFGGGPQQPYGGPPAPSWNQPQQGPPQQGQPQQAQPQSGGAHQAQPGPQQTGSQPTGGAQSQQPGQPTYGQPWGAPEPPTQSFPDQAPGSWGPTGS